jgi:light-regulated signal transduction histidine kinase (bacteriophytochrome)
LRTTDGWSLALMEDYGDRLDRQGLQYLSRVGLQAQYMAEVIDNLIKLARVTRSEMHRATVSLSELASECMAELQRMEPLRTVECVVQPGLKATGDAVLLSIALQNLLGNAWKFTGRKQRARIEFGMEKTPEGDAYYVRDNGAGFDMAYAKRLFTAFHRLHGASEFPGSGIGLATVRRIIQRHGGRIWAQAQEREGATFYFTLGESAKADIAVSGQHVPALLRDVSGDTPAHRGAESGAGAQSSGFSEKR